MAPKGPYVACGRVIIFATLEQQQPNFMGLAQIGFSAHQRESSSSMYMQQMTSGQKVREVVIKSYQMVSSRDHINRLLLVK